MAEDGQIREGGEERESNLFLVIDANVVLQLILTNAVRS